jgi:hypothetical protein
MEHPGAESAGEVGVERISGETPLPRHDGVGERPRERVGYIQSLLSVSAVLRSVIPVLQYQRGICSRV